MGTDISYSHDERRQLFLDSLVEFYEKLGSKKFWASGKARTIAIEALSQDYIRTDHKGYLEEDSFSLQAAMDEYHMRAKYLLGRVWE